MEQIVAASPVPVIVVVDPPRTHRIVVTIDAADTADTAVIDADLLADVARRLGAQWRCPILVVAGPEVADAALAPVRRGRRCSMCGAIRPGGWPTRSAPVIL